MIYSSVEDEDNVFLHEHRDPFDFSCGIGAVIPVYTNSPSALNEEDGSELFTTLSLSTPVYHKLPHYMDPNMGLIHQLKSLSAKARQQWKASPRFNFLPLAPSLASRNEDIIFVIGGIDPIHADEYLAGMYTIVNGLYPISRDPPGGSMFTYLCDTKEWEYAGTMPEPRSYHATSLIGDSIYITGGFSPFLRRCGEMIATSSTFSLCLKTKIWNKCADMIMSRAYHAMVSFQGKLYVFGGRNSSGSIISIVESYDPTLDIWIHEDLLPEPRMGLSATCFYNSIWIIGGMTSASDDEDMDCILASVYTFHPISKRWTAQYSLPEPRAFASAAAFDDKLWLFGGAVLKEHATTGISLFSTSLVDVFIPGCSKWQHQASFLYPRHSLSIAVGDAKVYIIGGIKSAERIACDEVEAFDRISETVSEYSSLPVCVAGCSSLYLPSKKRSAYIARNMMEKLNQKDVFLKNYLDTNGKSKPMLSSQSLNEFFIKKDNYSNHRSSFANKRCSTGTVLDNLQNEFIEEDNIKRPQLSNSSDSTYRVSSNEKTCISYPIKEKSHDKPWSFHNLYDSKSNQWNKSNFITSAEYMQKKDKEHFISVDLGRNTANYNDETRQYRTTAEIQLDTDRVERNNWQQSFHNLYDPKLNQRSKSKFLTSEQDMQRKVKSHSKLIDQKVDAANYNDKTRQYRTTAKIQLDTGHVERNVEQYDTNFMNQRFQKRDESNTGTPFENSEKSQKKYVVQGFKTTQPKDNEIFLRIPGSISSHKIDNSMLKQTSLDRNLSISHNPPSYVEEVFMDITDGEKTEFCSSSSQKKQTRNTNSSNMMKEQRQESVNAKRSHSYDLRAPRSSSVQGDDNSTQTAVKTINDLHSFKEYSNSLQESFDASKNVSATCENNETAGSCRPSSKSFISFVKSESFKRIGEKTKDSAFQYLLFDPNLGISSKRLKSQEHRNSLDKKKSQCEIPFFALTLPISRLTQELTLPVILSLGGLYPDTPTDAAVGQTILRFHPLKNSWEYAGCMPEPRNYHCVVLLNDNIYVIGGYDPGTVRNGEIISTNSVMSYELKERRWKQRQNMLRSRASHGAVVLDKRIFVLGGRDSLGRILSSVEVYYEEEDQWCEYEPMPYPVMGAAITVAPGLIWVIGGITYSNQTQGMTSHVVFYELSSSRWSYGPPTQYPVAYGSATYSLDCPWLYGGLTISENRLQSVREVYVLHYSAKTWFKIFDLSVPRHSSTSVSIESCTYLIGGMSTYDHDAVDTNDLVMCIEKELASLASLPAALTGMAAIVLPSIVANPYNKGHVEVELMLKKYFRLKR